MVPPLLLRCTGTPHTLYNADNSTHVLYELTHRPAGPLGESFFENLAGLGWDYGSLDRIHPLQVCMYEQHVLTRCWPCTAGAAHKHIPFMQQHAVLHSTPTMQVACAQQVARHGLPDPALPSGCKASSTPATGTGACPCCRCWCCMMRQAPRLETCLPSCSQWSKRRLCQWPSCWGSKHNIPHTGQEEPEAARQQQQPVQHSRCSNWTQTTSRSCDAVLSTTSTRNSTKLNCEAMGH